MSSNHEYSNYDNPWAAPPRPIDEFLCDNCAAVFRTHSELQSHKRQHLGGGRANPGMKNGSLRDQMRMQDDVIKKLQTELAASESKARHVASRLRKMEAEVMRLTDELVERNVKRQQAFEDLEKRKAMTSAIEAFSDEDLERMGVTREELLARVPQVQTSVQTENPIVLEMDPELAGDLEELDVIADAYDQETNTIDGYPVEAFTSGAGVHDRLMEMLEADIKKQQFSAAQDLIGMRVNFDPAKMLELEELKAEVAKEKVEREKRLANPKVKGMHSMGMVIDEAVDFTTARVVTEGVIDEMRLRDRRR